jgi:serine/threonine-protein kinase OSR1/STK39
VKNRRISGWKFNESKLELEPGFYADADVKTVRFGGETIIDTDTNIGLSESPGGSGDLEGLVVDHAGANMSGIEGAVETYNPDTIELKDLVEIKGHAEGIIVRSRRGADVSQMVQKIENLMEELILEKENNFKLKMLVLETINVVSSGVSTDAAAASAD